MTRKTFTIMAFMLLAATVATAAAAFAGTKGHCRSASLACQQAMGFDPVMQQVVAANNAASQAMLRLKLKQPPRLQRGSVVLVKPAAYSVRPIPAAPIFIPAKH
jgi:hypothetical protein